MNTHVSCTGGRTVREDTEGKLTLLSESTMSTFNTLDTFSSGNPLLFKLCPPSASTTMVLTVFWPGLHFCVSPAFNEAIFSTTGLLNRQPLVTWLTFNCQHLKQSWLALKNMRHFGWLVDISALHCGATQCRLMVLGKANIVAMGRFKQTHRQSRLFHQWIQEQEQVQVQVQDQV
jgi:hypothetical protein